MKKFPLKAMSKDLRRVLEQAERDGAVLIENGDKSFILRPVGHGNAEGQKHEEQAADTGRGQ